MDGQRCDGHSSAWAKARILLPDLATLYLCQHCTDAFGRTYYGEYHITYETVEVSA